MPLAGDASAFYLRVKRGKSTWFVDSVLPSDTVLALKTRLAPLVGAGEVRDLRLHLKATATTTTAATNSGLSGQVVPATTTTTITYTPLEEAGVLEQLGLKCDDTLYLALWQRTEGGGPTDGKWEPVSVIEPTMQGEE